MAPSKIILMESRKFTYYTLGEPNPDSHSTKRVQIRLSQSVFNNIVRMFLIFNSIFIENIICRETSANCFL